MNNLFERVCGVNEMCLELNHQDLYFKMKNENKNQKRKSKFDMILENEIQNQKGEME